MGTSCIIIGERHPGHQAMFQAESSAPGHLTCQKPANTSLFQPCSPHLSPRSSQWLAQSLRRDYRHCMATPWPLSARHVLLWALAIALLKSTQFLVQAFVWQNWPLDEVLLGWLDVALEHTIVAVLIALALLAGLRLKVPGAAKGLLVAVAVLAGASAGQLALIALDVGGAAQGVATFLGRVLAWSLVAGSVAGIYALSRRSVETRAALNEADLRRVAAERQLLEARVQTLRTQIEPHFLFNTLATVRRLHRTEPGEGAALLAHFIDYLRMALPALQERATSLGQEAELVHAYLSVVAVRMSGRLQVSWDVPDALRSSEFPPLMMATLVENAVKHGIAPAMQGGLLSIAARHDSGDLEVTVCDTGVGFSGSGGSGIGLANIRARLAALYGPAGRLTVSANAPHGVRACLRLPLRTLGVNT
jgi:signal transduction histidine kinase